MAPKKAGRAVQLPKGTVVPDGTKRSFALGTVLGRGGFGTVYSGKVRSIVCTVYRICSDLTMAPLSTLLKSNQKIMVRCLPKMPCICVH
jgi:hypothetical protein